METPLEQTLATCGKEKMLAYLHTNPHEVKELFQLALSDKQPYAWRAAWIMRSYLQKNDARLIKHIPKIIKALPELSDSQQRDLFFVLQKMEIKEKDEGLLFDISVLAWSKIEKMPSVRHNAFRIIEKMVLKHPELYNEVALLTSKEYTEDLSPGIQKVILRMIKNMQQKNKAKH